MANLRKQIRAAVRDLLLDNTDAGDRVFPSRVHPTYRLTYPAIFVFTTEEKAKTVQLAPRMYERTLTLKIQVVTAGVNVDSEDNIDTVMGQIEDLIDPVQQITGVGDDTDRGNVTISEYRGAEIDLFDEGQSDFASGVLDYEVKYYTEVDYPELTEVDSVEIDGETYTLE
jgi:hypothetical protein